MRKIITKTMSVLISLAIILLPARDAFSLPSGEVVVNGTAMFDRSEANTLKVTTSTNNVIINYDSFSIGENEYVYFYMPSVSASALNKVMGTDVSRLIGSLSANGRIFIVNPNGIVIGPQANINVASLIASTLSISNEDFLSGNYRFEDLSDEAARILNEGNITVAEGGFIALLSDSVENSGVITAERGSIALASGKKMTLSFDNDGLIQVAIDESTQEKLEGVDDAILNLGTISADGGMVLLKADTVKDVFKNAINNEGIVQAISVTEGEDGTIAFVGGEGNVINTGTIRTPMFTETGYTFKDSGTIEGGTAFFDNLDGGATISGPKGSDVYDTGDLTVDGDITLTADNLTFGADCDGGGAGDDGNGVFTMNAATTITGGDYNLTIKSAANNAAGTPTNSTLHNITGVDILILDDAGSAPTYVSDPTPTTGDILSCTDFRIDGGKLNRFTGSGPYVVYDVYGLQAMKGYLASDFTLNGNIDASGTSSWNAGAGFDPVGNASNNYYQGTFDGNGYTISNLTIDTTTSQDKAYIGLFGYTRDATLQDIGLVDVDIDGTYAGSIRAGGLVGYNLNADITNSYVTGTIGATATSSTAYAGGLTGYNYGFSSSTSNITNSYATGTITATATSGAAYAGGLVGYNYAYDSGASATITNSYATGNATANGSSGTYAGGLVGTNYGELGGSVNISTSYATGAIQATSTSNIAYAGGLVGYNYDLGTPPMCADITNSYATGNATASGSLAAYAGGLVGRNYANYDNGSAAITNTYATGSATAQDATSNYAGGLVGYLQDDGIGVASTISSFATGVASASGGTTNYAGGLIGRNVGGTITNCWWYNGTNTYGIANPQATGNKASAASDFYVTTQDVYDAGASTWDFSTIWTDMGDVYPEMPYVWTDDGGDSNASTADNWNRNLAPGASAHIIFNTTDTASATIDASFTPFVSKFTTQTGYTGTITTARDLTVNGDFTLGAGTFDLNGQTFNFGTPQAASVADGATIRLQGLSGTNEIGANVTNFDLDSGTVEYVGDGNSGAGTFYVRNFDAGAGADYNNLIINSTDTGGNADTFDLAGNLKTAGTLAVTSGTLDTISDYGVDVTGALTIDGGWITSTSGYNINIDAASINHTSGKIYTSGAGDDIYINAPGSIVLDAIESTGNIYIGSSSYGSTPSSVTLNDDIVTNSSSTYSLFAYSNGNITLNSDVGDSSYYFSNAYFYLNQSGGGSSNFDGNGNNIYANDIYADGNQSSGGDILYVYDINVYGNFHIGSAAYKPNSLYLGELFNFSSSNKNLYAYTNSYISQTGNVYNFNNSYFYLDQDGTGSGSFGSDSTYDTGGWAGNIYIDGHASNPTALILDNLKITGDTYIGTINDLASVTIDTSLKTTSIWSLSIYSNGDITQNGWIGSSDGSYYFGSAYFYLDQDGDNSSATFTGNGYDIYANGTVYVDGHSNGNTDLVVNGLDTNNSTVYLGSMNKPDSLTMSNIDTNTNNNYALNAYSNNDIIQSGYIGSTSGIYSFSTAFFYLDQDGDNSSATFTGSGYDIYSGSCYVDGHSNGNTDLVVNGLDTNNSTVYLGSMNKPDSLTMSNIDTNTNNNYALNAYSNNDIIQSGYIGSTSGIYSFSGINLYLDQDGDNSSATFTGNGNKIYGNGVFVEAHSNGNTDITVNGVDVSTTTFYVGNSNKPNSIGITGAIASGATNLYATNDITIGAAINSGSYTTTINSSSGSIYGDNANTITADTVTLSAANGEDIGKAGGQNLLVNTGTLTAITGNHPNICITNAGAGTLSVGAMTTGSATTIDFNKTLTLAGVSVSTGALTIGSTYASPTLNINGSLSSATTVDITASAISHTSGTISSTTGGDVSIDSSGTVGSFALGNITSTGGVVNIGQSTAPNSITQPQGSTITCDTLNISAVNDIGSSSNAVDTSGIDSLTYESQAGNVYIDIASETADTVTITNIDQTASYNLTCAKTVDITSLTSDGNVDITTSAGNINITDVTGAGYVNLSAPNGSILATGSTISGSSGKVEAGAVVGTSAKAINLAIDGQMTVIANGTSGLYSAYLTGRANLVTNDAPGIISMNGNLVHLPKGIGEAVNNTESTINEYEEMKDLETRPDGGKYIVNEVPAPEAPNLASEYIDTTNFVLESPYEFNAGPYLIAVPNVR